MKRRIFLIGSIVLVVVLVGQGCASGPTTRTEKVRQVDESPTAQKTPSQPQRGEKQPPSFAATPEPTRSASPKPVRILLARADSELRAGNLEQSAATLERALRIAPRDAVLWHKLAKIYLRQGGVEQAEAMAKKSNSLAATNASLRTKNWRIVAEARRLRGDDDGADQAERRARETEMLQ